MWVVIHECFPVYGTMGDIDVRREIGDGLLLAERIGSKGKAGSCWECGEGPRVGRQSRQQIVEKVLHIFFLSLLRPLLLNRKRRCLLEA